MSFEYVAMNSDLASRYRSGDKDAYGCEPVRAISDGGGNPCRHCMQDIPKGIGMLILAYRPFHALHPYAETGPIFLCADGCEAFGRQDTVPPAISSRQEFILRGYDNDEAIVGGTGKVTKTENIPAYLASLFANDKVEGVHIRSASNNCYFCKVEAVD